MERLRIYVDLSMPDEARHLLIQETSGHELLMPMSPAKSVLSVGKPDASFAQADVAFGQPDAEAVRHAPRLRWVHVSSSGITRYDTLEFRRVMAERGIFVTNSASVYENACALHALGFMLAQARQLPPGLASQVSNGSPAWNALREQSSTLEGETALIIGFGAIGRRLAELLVPLRMRIIGFRRHARGTENVPIIAAEQLPSALSKADHVINILPDSPETRGFFSRSRFEGMKHGSCFYNIGRGVTVDQSALDQALRSGRIAAAWLDVTDPEPLPSSHPLRALPNCHITPHTAGGHRREALTLVRHFLANLRRFEASEPLLDRVM
jgi:phosphoglycerate dehydrogenase-like enzyme